MKKVAFFTPGFLSEDSKQGGIGNYIFKISSALKKHGHQPEVFVTSILGNETVEYNGIKVHRVFVDYFILRALRKISKISKIQGYYKILEDLINSFLVYRRFKAVNNREPYDILQTANNKYLSLFISPNQNFCHLHRISSNRILFDKAEHGKEVGFRQKLRQRIEFYCARRADVVYAPSSYLAEYLNSNFELDVKVVRPPSVLGDINFDVHKQKGKLPQKYFLHYGTMGRRKGTDILAKALKRALKEEPNIKMVFMGRFAKSCSSIGKKSYWEEYSDNVIFLGQVQKEYVYKIVKNAVATVLPSRSDNLPNTVIESLHLGTPVIGTYDSSIDEIVQDGKNGLLVPKESVNDLSDNMLKVWTNEVKFNRQKVPLHNLMEPFKVENAVSNFLKLCD